MLADDHRVFIEGLRATLEKVKDIHVADAVHSGEILMHKVKDISADVLVLDISLEQTNGLDLIEPIHKVQPELAIVILSMHAEEKFVRTAFERGALGYILKKSTGKELENAIRATHKGEKYYCREVAELVMKGLVNLSAYRYIDLTSREVEVLKAIAKGLSSKEIAEVLFISVNTVKTHRKHLMEKLPVKNSAGLVKFAVDNGLLEG